MRALVFLFVVSACDAGEKPPPPEALKPIAKAVQPKPSPTPFALDYLPADADLVMHLDVAKLRRSKLWAAYANDVSKVVMRGLSGCEYQPMQDISSIMIGMSLETDVNMFVVRGLDRDKTLHCLAEQKEKHVHVDPGFVSYPVSSGTHLLKFVDAKTVVIQGAKQPSKETLTKALQAGAPLAKDAAFVAAVESARKNGVADAAFTLVSRPGSAQLARHMPTIDKLKHISATARLTDRLDLRYSMTVDSVDAATQLLKKTKKEVLDNNTMKQMVDRIDVTAQGETITTDLGMTESQTKSMAQMLQGLVPRD